MMYKTPDASFFLSHYPTLRETLTIPVVFTIHIITHNLVWIMFSLLDLVPGIVFYCAGKHIQSIEQQLKEDFETLLLLHPLGLYCITNSIILTILSLTVSYVIVLVQL